MLKKLIVVRHAEPARGDADPGLSERGCEQAALLAGRVQAVVDGGSAPVIISSTRRRAVQTANAVAFAFDVDVRQHPLLWDGETEDIVAYLTTEARRVETLVVVGHLEQGWSLLEAFAQKVCAVAPRYGHLALGHAEGCVLDMKKRALFTL